MAACGSLQHIFENPLPESPTLLESLSPWKAIKNMKPIENSTFTEIFGELHFKENHQHESSSPSSSSSSSSLLPESSPSSSSSLSPLNRTGAFDESPKNNDGERSNCPTSPYYPSSHKKQYKHSDSFSSVNSESLSLCTEGLGFESSDDVEDLGNETSFDFQNPEEKTCYARRHSGLESLCKESKRSRTNRGSFPPPISCIGRTGKPWVCFKSYRQDGRFILQEIRFPAQEFLHACREDGRLRLQLIQSDDEILEGDEDEDEEDEDEDEDNDDASEDTQDVNEEAEGADDDNHENHQELKNDAQDDDDDAEEGVQMSTNDVQDSSD